MDQFATASFPQNVLHHSALRYLQELLTERCAALPVTFATLDAWQAYREGLVAFLRERLPIWTLEPTVPARRTGCFDLHDDLILEAIDVPFDRAYTIPVHLYRPRTPAEQRAVVLVCPGYGQEKNAATIADLCMALARAGILAVAIDYDATGERGDRPDFETGINNVTAVGQLLGITNVGLRVMNNLAALAYVRTREDVDPARIGITGFCQGAIVTWFTAAICPEFAAVAPLCGATTYQAIALEYANRQGGWSGISPYVFDLLRYADVPHLLAAVAPRPLFVQNNIIDMHWPYAGLEAVKTLVEQVYRLHGVDAHCRFRVEHAPHAYAEPFITNLTTWFGQVL